MAALRLWMCVVQLSATSASSAWTPRRAHENREQSQFPRLQTTKTTQNSLKDYGSVYPSSTQPLRPSTSQLCAGGQMSNMEARERRPKPKPERELPVDIDKEKLKKAFDISHFNVNAILRGAELTLVGGACSGLILQAPAWT